MGLWRDIERKVKRGRKFVAGEYRAAHIKDKINDYLKDHSEDFEKIVTDGMTLFVGRLSKLFLATFSDKLPNDVKKEISSWFQDAIDYPVTKNTIKKIIDNTIDKVF